MLKVWIVGSEGQIGEAINEVLDPLEIEVLNTDQPSGCDHQLCCDHRCRALREAAGGGISCKRFRRP